MRISAYIVMIATFGVAAGLALIAASFAVSAIEDNTEIGVRDALDRSGYPWAEVQADGLQVVMSGEAPSEVERFRAISVAGGVVDAARVIDAMDVAAVEPVAPPRFSAEILRNDGGISIIGLVPASTDREALVARLTRIAGDDPVTDLLESADYRVPEGWGNALAYAIDVLEELPRSKISVDAGRIAVTAITDSAKEKAQVETALVREAPRGLRVAFDISAPRPVITPFTLRFIRDADGARFDACSAETEDSAARILAAAREAGLQGKATCTIGMGVPSPHWAEATEAGLDAVAKLEGGSITFADADVTLVALEGTSERAFDRIVGELEAALPDVFALHAVLPKPPESPAEGPSEFYATLSPEGLVQLRGRVGSDAMRELADSYAKARFGSDAVYTATRIVPDLPADWSVRILAGLEALSKLENGVVTVTEDDLAVEGTGTREDLSAEIARLLSAKLGEEDTYRIDVGYRAPPPPAEAMPDPDICEERIDEVLAGGQITFEPGSATIDESSIGTVNRIADILRECGDLRLEIQGHTDSQGREVMNQQLSQARAQSVLNELRARRILTSNFVARGYGESQPIADNDTEDGREANRRIEFRLIRPEPIEPQETTLESVASQSVEDAEAEDQTTEGGDR